MDTGVLIAVIAVVAVVVIAGLVLAARSGRNRKHRTEAAEIRQEVHEQIARVDKRQALADETDARARAAEAEAEAKAAEAKRLRERAAGHADAAASTRDELSERSKYADRIDPDLKKRDRRDDDADGRPDEAERVSQDTDQPLPADGHTEARPR